MGHQLNSAYVTLFGNLSFQHGFRPFIFCLSLLQKKEEFLQKKFIEVDDPVKTNKSDVRLVRDPRISCNDNFHAIINSFLAILL